MTKFERTGPPHDPAADPVVYPVRVWRERDDGRLMWERWTTVALPASMTPQLALDEARLQVRDRVRAWRDEEAAQQKLPANQPFDVDPPTAE